MSEKPMRSLPVPAEKKNLGAKCPKVSQEENLPPSLNWPRRGLGNGGLEHDERAGAGHAEAYPKAETGPLRYERLAELVVVVDSERARK
jgi:hypothetical protein